MRKSLAMALLVSLVAFAGMQVASFNPSPSQLIDYHTFPRGTYVSRQDYDPERIKYSIVTHQLVENPDFGVYRC